MHTSGDQYILFYFLFQFVVNKTEKSAEFTKGIVLLSLSTNKMCRFEIIDGVKYVYCIKHAYKFLLKEQVGFAAVLWRLRQCVIYNSVNDTYVYIKGTDTKYSEKTKDYRLAGTCIYVRFTAIVLNELYYTCQCLSILVYAYIEVLHGTQLSGSLRHINLPPPRHPSVI